MELRRGTDHRPLYLPPRSLLVLADEARLGWHHYIPHRRSDTVAGRRIPRASRRLSFTFRKVTFQACRHQYPMASIKSSHPLYAVIASAGDIRDLHTLHCCRSGATRVSAAGQSAATARAAACHPHALHWPRQPMVLRTLNLGGA